MKVWTTSPHLRPWLDCKGAAPTVRWRLSLFNYRFQPGFTGERSYELPWSHDRQTSAREKANKYPSRNTIMEIGLTWMSVHSLIHTLPPPASTSENFHPVLTRLFSADCQYLTSIRTRLCLVTVANVQPSTRQRTGQPRYILYPAGSRVWLYSRSPAALF